MIATLLKERVHLRKVTQRSSDPAEPVDNDVTDSLQVQRRAAGLRFIAKLRRHNLGDLAPRVYLAPMITGTGRYREAWMIDFSSDCSREWFTELDKSHR